MTSPAATDPTLPSGAAGWSHVYFDETGRRRQSRRKVPVNPFGELAAKGFHCTKCAGRPASWFPLTSKNVPACLAHGQKMTPVVMKAPARLPLRPLWDAIERPLRPVWTLPAMAAAGLAVDTAHIPTLAVAGLAPIVGFVSYRLASTKLACDDPGLRAAVARSARGIGWTTAVGTGWLALADTLTMTPHSALAAALLWGGLLAATAWPVATWWRYCRRPDIQAPLPTPAGPAAPDADQRDAADAAHTWKTEVEAAGTAMDPATWARIPCGWQAVVHATKKGALNALGGEGAKSTVKRVAAAYDVPFSAITWIENYEDSPNRALLLVQSSNPLSVGQVWDGPGTVDIRRGVAESGRLIDGTTMYDTLYRYGWGAPSEIVLGTTGGGKSARARKKLIVERYAAFEVEPGVFKGTFISILHDPKRLESYAEFRDALHAYGMTRDDAHIIIDALLRECYRRYDFLAGLEWRDAKGRRRRGGLAWNPLEHGPIISHFWDEFHELAGDQEFVKKLEKLARLQRACAMRGTLLSHMGTLGDTGSQALRDMLAGGRATLFRTTSALNAGLVTGGQLSSDPRTLPRQPGMCYVADGETAAIMGRESYIPGGEEPGNVYDWLFDDDNKPIGFPAKIPLETAEAFGTEFMEWAAAGRRPEGRTFWQPSESASPQVRPRSDVRCVDAVFAALASSSAPLDMNALESHPAVAAVTGSTRTIRDALKKLRNDGQAFTSGSGVGTRYELTPQARDLLERDRTAAAEAATCADESR